MITATLKRRYDLAGASVADFTIAVLEPTGKSGKLAKSDLAGKVAVIQLWKDPKDLDKIEELVKIYENSDQSIVFVPISANVREYVFHEPGRLVSKLPAVIRAEARLLGRKNIRMAVDKEKSFARALGLFVRGSLSPCCWLLIERGVSGLLRLMKNRIRGRSRN